MFITTTATPLSAVRITLDLLPLNVLSAFLSSPVVFGFGAEPSQTTHNFCSQPICFHLVELLAGLLHYSYILHWVDVVVLLQNLAQGPNGVPGLL